MKIFTKKTMLAAFTMLAAMSAQAQYISEAPAGGFDFSKGKDYVVIFTPEEQVTAMGDKILSNQNLDPTQTNNYFSYWVADWDHSLFTLYDCPNDAKNSWGGDTKLNMTPLFNWGSGQFTPKGTFRYDLSAIDDEHILHIGFMNIGGEGKSANYRFWLGPTNRNGFLLEVNKTLGTSIGDYVGVGMASARNTWYYLDIPVKDLVDVEGDFGFGYDFKNKFTGFCFTCGFDVDDASCTKYTAGAVDPDTGMKKITINQMGSAMAVDHVFLYKKSGSTGIDNITSVLSKSEGVSYNLNGQQVGSDYRGIVIKNGKKMLVK